MHLKDLRYPDDATFERLVSCSPVLEVLKVSGYRDVPRVFRVHSLSVKRLKTDLWKCFGTFQVVIDVPQVRVLTIHDDDSESYIIKNLSSSFKLDITLSFEERVHEASVSSMRNRIRDFLPGISKVGEMNMYLNTFKVLFVNGLHISILHNERRPFFLPHNIFVSAFRSNFVTIPNYDHCLNFITCPACLLESLYRI